MIFLTCALAALLSVAAPARAADGQAALQRFIDEVKTYRANFSQLQVDERGGKLAESSGYFVLARPDRFRWEYQQPYVQQIVSDGAQLWLYEPDLAQVTRRRAATALSGTPAELLLNGAQLADNFELSDLGGTDGVSHLRLKPRAAESDFASIELWLANGAPQQMLFVDHLGSRTEIHFTAISINKPVADSELRFVTPPGTDVVDEGG